MPSRSDLPRSLAARAPGCVAWLVIWSAIAFLLDRAFSPQIDPAFRPWPAAISAVLLTLGLSNLWQLAIGYGRGPGSRRDVLDRAAAGRLPERDGLAVVTGAVRASGATLRAPLSGTECVAYMYTMYYEASIRSEHEIRVPVYWGQACRPFVIDTPGQPVRVLAVPRLADPSARCDSPDEVERARQYVAATRFEEVDAGALGPARTAVELVKAMFADDDGERRRDWMTAGGGRDPATLMLEETVLPVGADVSVAGHWSMSRQAFVSHVDANGAQPVSITTGSIEDLGESEAGLPHSRTSVAVTSLALFALGAGVLWAAMALFPG